MLLQAHNLFVLTRLFLLEQIRFPLGIFWGMLAPPILFFFFNIESIGSGYATKDWYVSQSAWFLSYIITSVSLYGFSIYLVGRRESGFLRSFVIGRRGRALFISAQFISAVVLSLVYSLFFLLTTSLSFGVNLFTVIPDFFIPYALVTLVFMSCSVFFLLLPLNFQNANSVVSIAFMLMVMISLANSRLNSEILKAVNAFNPIYIGELLISSNLSLSPGLLLLFCILILISINTAINLKTNPIWEGQ